MGGLPASRKRPPDLGWSQGSVEVGFSGSVRTAWSRIIQSGLPPRSKNCRTSQSIELRGVYVRGNEESGISATIEATAHTTPAGRMANREGEFLGVVPAGWRASRAKAQNGISSVVYRPPLPTTRWPTR